MASFSQSPEKAGEEGERRGGGGGGRGFDASSVGLHAHARPGRAGFPCFGESLCAPASGLPLFLARTNPSPPRVPFCCHAVLALLSRRAVTACGTLSVRLIWHWTPPSAVPQIASLLHELSAALTASGPACPTAVLPARRAAAAGAERVSLAGIPASHSGGVLCPCLAPPSAWKRGGKGLGKLRKDGRAPAELIELTRLKRERRVCLSSHDGTSQQHRLMPLLDHHVPRSVCASSRSPVCVPSWSHMGRRIPVLWLNKVNGPPLLPLSLVAL